jgi:hypothetical protein
MEVEVFSSGSKGNCYRLTQAGSSPLLLEAGKKQTIRGDAFQMPPQIMVHPGDRYGRLIILQEAEKIKGKRFFLCACDCGEIRTFRFEDMRSA